MTAAVVDLGEDNFPDVLLYDGSSWDSVEFYAPDAANNFMTLVYNPLTFTVTLTIQGYLPSARDVVS